MQNVTDSFTNWSSLLVCNLATLARPAAALSGAPVLRGRQGRLAAPRKKESISVLVYIYSRQSIVE